MLMMTFGSALICYCWFFVTVFSKQLYLGHASKIALTADPTSVTVGITKILVMRCSLQNVPARNDTVQQGWAEPFRATVNSISITRDSSTTIASISSQHPAVASADVDTLRVRGDLTPSVDSSYLQLTWTKPGLNQTGMYTCRINATGHSGQDVLYKSHIHIYHKRPDSKDIIQYIHELEDALSQTQRAVKECERSSNAEIRDVRISLNNSQSDLQRQVDISNAQDAATTAALRRLETGASSLRTDLTTVQNSLYSYVVEEGLRFLGGSADFQRTGSSSSKRGMVYVKFTKRFSKLPTVMCHLQYIDADYRRNLRFNYYVRDLTASGFNLIFETWADTILYQIAVKWRASIP